MIEMLNSFVFKVVYYLCPFESQMDALLIVMEPLDLNPYNNKMGNS